MAVLPADVGDWTFSVVYCKFTYLQCHILNYFTLALDPIGRLMAKDMNSGRNEVLTKIPFKWSIVEQVPSRSGGGRGREIVERRRLPLGIVNFTGGLFPDTELPWSDPLPPRLLRPQAM